MAATKLELIENRRTELHAAFLAFGSVSDQLSGAFESLSGEVARLRADLQEAHAGKEHLASRLSALIQGLPGGVLVLDSRGEIREFNPAARDLLGEPLLGQLFSTVRTRAAVNPLALKKLLAGGAKLHGFSPAIMEASFKATKELNAEVAAGNANFKKIYDSVTAYTATSYQWFQVAEIGFDNFMARHAQS